MTKTIMIVDDEPDIGVSVKALLESEGYDVEYCEDGKACLRALKKSKPDLILLDFFMSGMSGRGVVGNIRKTDKTVKIIFLTVAEFRERGFKRFKELGVLGYLSKPLVNRELLKTVKNALKK